MRTHDSESSAGEAALRRGIAAARAGLRSVAAAQFERAVESLPDDPNVWLWLAWVSNSPDNTIRCLERVLELSPEHATAKAGLAWACALSHDAPIEPVAVAVARNVAECEAPVEVETQIESPVSESPAAVIELVCEADKTDTTLEAPVELTWDTIAEQRQAVAETTSIADPVEVAVAAVTETSLRQSDASLPLEPSPRRWSDLLQRGPESLADTAAWPSLVPPPLPSLSPPPLPAVAENAPSKLESVAPPRFAESSAANPIVPVTTTSDLVPAQEANTDVEALTTSFNPPKETAAADGRPLVMVVDDSPTVRKLVSLTLERRGYRVISAFDGVAAIKELGSCRPDLILLDINMPRLDGYRLCKLIKKHEATQTIPVVMLSGKDGMFDKLRGRLVGCSDYITKPFEADALTHKVAKYLTSTSSL